MAIPSYPQPYTKPAHVRRYPQLMNFYEFVRNLDSNVDEVTACKQFKDFKTNLMQVSVDKFFDEHKHEEWFRNKYHPQDSLTSITAKYQLFLKRLGIYHDLLSWGHFEKLKLDADHSQAIINTLNAIIILLDDGPSHLSDSILKAGNNTITNDEITQYIPSVPHSIFIDNLNISTTSLDVEEICQKANPDLIKISQFDPYYVKGGELRHRMLAIYKPSVDIHETCWKLSRSKINDQSPNVFINKPVTNRVKIVDFKTNHNYSVVKDIRNAIRIILNLDELSGLYGRRRNNLIKVDTEHKVNIKKELANEQTVFDNGDYDMTSGVAPPSPPGSEKSAESFDISSLDQDREKEKKKYMDMKFNFDLSHRKLAKKLAASNNTLLQTAQTYLTDYAYNTVSSYQLSCMPAELIPKDRSLDHPTEPMIEYLLENISFSYDDNVKTLDKLIWYLRIVHSYDYYGKCFYRHENEMPLKLTFIHVRDSPTKLTDELDLDTIKDFSRDFDCDLKKRLKEQNQTFLTKEEERYAFRTYKKNIQNELESYAERIPNPKKNNETVDAYKCKHCTKMFQKLQNVGLHFVSKHREAIDYIEMETDFFNSYLFDTSKINPKPPKSLLEYVHNKFYSELSQLSKRVEDDETNVLRETIETYKKIEPFVMQEAPRKVEDSQDPRNEASIDYDDISFDDAL